MFKCPYECNISEKGFVKEMADIEIMGIRIAVIILRVLKAEKPVLEKRKYSDIITLTGAEFVS